MKILQTPWRSGLLFAAAAALTACASYPVYTPPGAGEPAADVKVNVYYSSKNYYTGLVLRGAVKCNEVPLSKLLHPTVEGPGVTLAMATSSSQVANIRLPAGKPVALRYTYQQVTTTRVWDFVVMLEPGRSYEANLDMDTGPSVVDTATQTQALRLPHDWFKRNLQCS